MLIICNGKAFPARPDGNFHSHSFSTAALNSGPPLTGPPSFHSGETGVSLEGGGEMSHGSAPESTESTQATSEDEGLLETGVGAE